MLWLQRQAHVHGTLEIVASGALSRATRLNTDSVLNAIFRVKLINTELSGTPC